MRPVPVSRATSWIHPTRRVAEPVVAVGGISPLATPVVPSSLDSSRADRPCHASFSCLNPHSRLLRISLFPYVSPPDSFRPLPSPPSPDLMKITVPLPIPKFSFPACLYVCVRVHFGVPLSRLFRSIFAYVKTSWTITRGRREWSYGLVSTRFVFLFLLTPVEN